MKLLASIEKTREFTQENFKCPKLQPESKKAVRLLAYREFAGRFYYETAQVS